METGGINAREGGIIKLKKQNKLAETSEEWPNFRSGQIENLVHFYKERMHWQAQQHQEA